MQLFFTSVSPILLNVAPVMSSWCNEDNSSVSHFSVTNVPNKPSAASNIYCKHSKIPLKRLGSQEPVQRCWMFNVCKACSSMEKYREAWKSVYEGKPQDKSFHLEKSHCKIWFSSGKREGNAWWKRNLGHFNSYFVTFTFMRTSITCCWD